MKRLLASITGTQKISVPMTIVGSGIAKMFVGELVETGRIVMKERNESGPIRPCHIREAYRRLRLEGKVPRRSVPRLFQAMIHFKESHRVDRVGQRINVEDMKFFNLNLMD
ncbi:hypothetical protein HPP92_027935 [Vanilla planifolia]|uniref:TAFII28-like protein domain-containing protein n=1 Tax=Vanilla planifolia TaxID=51239 RepID=A0A835P9V1_VANPL|nr:hypothetical protein HPP92_027935 [Vanilla planifolia]